MSETEFDERPDYPRPLTGPFRARTKDGALHQEIEVDNSINKPLPWVVLLAIVATAALCLSVWSLWVNLDNRRILGERIADANRLVESRIADANRASDIRDKEIRNELQLNRNHVDAFDNRVIVLTKLEDNYHARHR